MFLFDLCFSIIFYLQLDGIGAIGLYSRDLSLYCGLKGREALCKSFTQLNRDSEDAYDGDVPTHESSTIVEDDNNDSLFKALRRANRKLDRIEAILAQDQSSITSKVDEMLLQMQGQLHTIAQNINDLISTVQGISDIARAGVQRQTYGVQNGLQKLHNNLTTKIEHSTSALTKAVGAKVNFLQADIHNLFRYLNSSLPMIVETSKTNNSSTMCRVYQTECSQQLASYSKMVQTLVSEVQDCRAQGCTYSEDVILKEPADGKRVLADRYYTGRVSDGRPEYTSP